MPNVLTIRSGQTITTQLTPNCNTQANATFDLNDSTWVTFYYQNRIPLWMALVSVANPEVTLLENIVSSGITLERGLKVELNPMNHYITIFLYGTIIDSGMTYFCDGAVLGSFSRSQTMKQAMRAIQIHMFGAHGRQFQEPLPLR